MPCLNIDLISSEDSDEDTENETRQFITRPLPWRSDKVTRFFQQLDKRHHKGTTHRSKMMSFKRIEGDLSDRLRPISTTVPEWAFAA